MSLQFIGRLNSEGRQCFKSGIIKMKGLVRKVKALEQRPVKDIDGKFLADDRGNPLYAAVEVEVDQAAEYVFKPTQIGSVFEAGEDEGHLLAKYSLSIKSV
jgi:hypothetical protein